MGSLLVGLLLFSDWCDQMFMGAVLLGVWLLLGLV